MILESAFRKKKFIRIESGYVPKMEGYTKQNSDVKELHVIVSKRLKAEVCIWELLRNRMECTAR